MGPHRALWKSAAKDQYCNLLCDFQLTQLVDFPSRVQNTLLALSIMCCVHLVFVRPLLHRLLHWVIIMLRLLFLQLLCSALLLTTSHWVQYFCSCKWDIIKDKLPRIPWSTVEVFDDIEDVWVFQYCYSSFNLFG